jgi:hypothetical protein
MRVSHGSCIGPPRALVGSDKPVDDSEVITHGAELPMHPTAHSPELEEQQRDRGNMTYIG